MKLLPYSNIKDLRGSFIGLLNNGEWKEVNYVETKKGFIRGKHYHKFTHEVIYLLSGRALVKLQNVLDPSETKELVLNEMEGLLIEPYMLHDFEYTEDSSHIAFLNNAFDEKNPDLHSFNQ